MPLSPLMVILVPAYRNTFSSASILMPLALCSFMAKPTPCT